MKASIALVVLALFALLAAVPLLVEIAADTIDVDAGNVYYAELESAQDTFHWAGLKVTHNAVELSESNAPFATILLDAPLIASVQFPGANFKDDLHWYGATFTDTFNASRILNVTPSDLQSEELFSSALFPVFYPDYTDKRDNPDQTFCCTTANVEIGGENYSAFVTQIDVGINYYLLNYDNEGTNEPLFLVSIEDATCYNSTACVAQFMLPITDTPYNFFAISKLTAYTYRVFIDGVQTTTFGQTALPYNVTVEVSNLYSGNVAPGVSVLIGEEDGQNIFVPYRFNGYVSNFYTVGSTDGNGRETFLIAPTEYPTMDNYSIYVAVLQESLITSRESLSITNKDSLVQISKPLTPSTLYDDAKTSTNALNQINSFLFTWSSQLLQAYRYSLQYELVGGIWTVSPAHTAGSTFELKTGAPNVLQLFVTSGGIPQSGYTVRVQETDGYLIMNPYTGSTPLDPKDRVSNSQNLPTGTQFVVTPTSLGAVESNITLEILDSNGDVVAELPAVIDADLNIGSGGVFYNNDLLKTVANSMNQVVSSLFYALNF